MFLVHIQTGHAMIESQNAELGTSSGSTSGNTQREALGERRFQSTGHQLRVNLLMTHAWLAERLQRFLGEYGITQQQYNVLRILRSAAPAPLTTCEIRERLIDRRADTSRMVERLAQKGWVAKHPCQRDRRRVDVHITAEGLALLAGMEPRFSEMDEMLQGISEEEARMLIALLTRLRK